MTVSRHLLAGALIDAGLFLQALMFAARGAGLDTCPQASLIPFHPVLRDQLSIPEDQTIVCGLALGTPTPNTCSAPSARHASRWTISRSSTTAPRDTSL
ncbi:nitroreductase family protein [Actinomadura sp. KC216]|uniref:nitroreductase family protein n=1 Tax=Actinomadura sp. KC216 TaxID=2530370 RepID=UPI001FB7FEF3|nr:nitroreductase family protein [Actinomadura sp. KC216]